jgi:YjjG family noncanonical pyrimidine nucleotidase
VKTSSNSGYEAFILDADNTLFDFNRAEKAALREALLAGGYDEIPENTYARYHAINDQLWKLFERGKITQDGLRVERFRRLLDSLALPNHLDGPPDPQLLGEQYIEALSEKGNLLPHARSVLQLLSAKTPLLLLSNGIGRVQRGRIHCSGIGVYFKDILISGETGLAKPDPAIFRLAVEKLRCSADQVLCVGDSPSSDIRGAHHAGLDTCWFAPAGAEYPRNEPQPLYRINDLRQLLQFLPAGT